VLYSWPSQGSAVGYLSDAAVVQLSARRLTRFLDDLVARSGATTIHIVAHSMGNRALTEALELMALRRGQTAAMPPVFEQIVFAAPDVDAGLFAEMIPAIRPLARRLTLYASENDWALVASRKLHGDAPRAGQGGDGTLVSPVIDSVDMSDLGQDMLAHGYFADDSSALVDLVALFWRNIPPEQRCGLERHSGSGGLAVWRYLPGSCPDNALLAVMGTLRDHEVSTATAARETVEEVVPDPVLQSEIEPLILRMLFN
jgi:esterase/lipase superfamily enzyme